MNRKTTGSLGRSKSIQNLVIQQQSVRRVQLMAINMEKHH